MSYRFAKDGCEVRWRDTTGRHRSRRFRNEEAAREFDKSIHDHELAERCRQARHGQGGAKLSGWDAFVGSLESEPVPGRLSAGRCAAEVR